MVASLESRLLDDFVIATSDDVRTAHRSISQVHYGCPRFPKTRTILLDTYIFILWAKAHNKRMKMPITPPSQLGDKS